MQSVDSTLDYVKWLTIFGTIYIWSSLVHGTQFWLWNQISWPARHCRSDLCAKTCILWMACQKLLIILAKNPIFQNSESWIRWRIIYLCSNKWTQRNISSISTSTSSTYIITTTIIITITIIQIIRTIIKCINCGDINSTVMWKHLFFVCFVCCINWSKLIAPNGQFYLHSESSNWRHFQLLLRFAITVLYRYEWVQFVYVCYVAVVVWAMKMAVSNGPMEKALIGPIGDLPFLNYWSLFLSHSRCLRLEKSKTQRIRISFPCSTNECIEYLTIIQMLPNMTFWFIQSFSIKF